jgi:hypothetical protein
MEHKEHRVLKEIKAFREHKELRVKQEQVSKVHLDLMEHREHKVLKVTPEHRVLKVNRG